MGLWGEEANFDQVEICLARKVRTKKIDSDSKAGFQMAGSQRCHKVRHNLISIRVYSHKSCASSKTLRDYYLRANGQQQ